MWSFTTTHTHKQGGIIYRLASGKRAELTLVLGCTTHSSFIGRTHEASQLRKQEADHSSEVMFMGVVSVTL
jgi:hypothetical protein